MLADSSVLCALDAASTRTRNELGLTTTRLADPEFVAQYTAATLQFHSGQLSTRTTEDLIPKIKYVTSLVVDDAQADSIKTGRVDLSVQVEELCQHPVLAKFVQEMLSAEPDRSVLKASGTPWFSTSRFEKSGSQGSIKMVVAPTTMDTPPACLGGPWHITEVYREVEFTCRYAKWRDRRNRRLARIKVVSIMGLPPASICAM